MFHYMIIDSLGDNLTTTQQPKSVQWMTMNPSVQDKSSDVHPQNFVWKGEVLHNSLTSKECTWDFFSKWFPWWSTCLSGWTGSVFVGFCFLITNRNTHCIKKDREFSIYKKRSRLKLSSSSCIGRIVLLSFLHLGVKQALKAMNHESCEYCSTPGVRQECSQFK